jgi:sugar phosphate isomerase/epimerase
MRFGFVTDELYPDPRQAIETALAWGVHDFEIRNVRGERFPRVSDHTLDELVALRDEFGIRYTAVSPGFFKCHLDDEASIAYALGDGLARTLDFTARCEIPIIICFGFEMATGTDDQAVTLLREWADRLAGHNVRGAVENETHCKFDTPARIAQLIQRVDRPNLGANWDVGNLQQGAREGFPQGYALVKPHIFNVHVKDVAQMPDGTMAWKPIGEGMCDWTGQIRALARDGIVDHVTIESHCGPKEAVGLHNLTTLRRILDEAE